MAHRGDGRGACRAFGVLAFALAACGEPAPRTPANGAPVCADGSTPTSPSAETRPDEVEVQIALDAEVQPERALVARFTARGAVATATRALSLEAAPADVKVATAKDGKGELPSTVEAGNAGRTVIRFARTPTAPLEVTVRVRAEEPKASVRPVLGIDDDEARIPGEVIPLPEPLSPALVELSFVLGTLSRQNAQGGSTLSATKLYRDRASLAAVRNGYSVLVDGEVGTARFHTNEGDDHASWAGYTSFDPRWAFAETAGVRTGVDRYLGTRSSPIHGIVMVSDRRRELPFAMVPRASGLWISADIEAPWDATPLLRVAQHFAQRFVGGALWMGYRGGPREPEGWFWSEGVSRVVGRESLYQLGLVSYDDLAADLNAALAEGALSKLRAAKLDALVIAANSGGDDAIDARRMLAARGILWASGVDARMRSSSKGEKDLRSVMRAILAEAGKQGRDTWSVEELAKYVASVTTPAEEAAFRRTIIDGAPAGGDLPPGGAGTCHELLSRKLSRFELGFEWTAPPKPSDPTAPPPTHLGTVSVVKKDSAAERAGVAVGDRIDELKYVPGRGDVAAKLKVTRAGKAVAISYAPHGPEREGPMFVRKQGAKDETCAR